MIRGAAAAGLASLGLIGGTGYVTYDDDGTAAVKIKNRKTGTEQTVQIPGGSGKGFMCPASVEDSLAPHDIKAGRIKLTLRPVRRRLATLDEQYPGRTAPATVANEFNALARREKRLVSAYNQQVDARNAVLKRECDPAG